MAHAVAVPKLAPTVRAEAITADGKRVLIEASGPGTTVFERARARRNHRRWCAGLRPNRLGLWRKP